MSETLRFDCPSCGIHLSVPLAAAGVEGPCPVCSAIITAPPPPHAEPPIAATTIPSPSVEQKKEAPEPPPTEHLPEPESPSASQRATPSHRPVRPPSVLSSCIATGVVAMAIGYGIGRITSCDTRTPDNPPAFSASTGRAEPTAEEVTPKEVTPPTPLPAIAAPEAALRAFLSAKDGQERLRHCLFPEAVAPRMAERGKDNPEGPIQALSLKVEHSETDRTTGRMLFIFQVATPVVPAGIPVAVMETADGWKVDWESFTEFHDDRFKKFADGSAPGPEDFHLIARNTHYLGEPFEGIERYTTYRVDPPMADRGHYAFVATGSDIQKKLAMSTENGMPFTPVLRLVKSKSPDGKAFIEITGITATDWRPRSP